MRIGIWVFGLASVAAGVLDLVWGEFEPAHQPLQAWGEVPGVKIFACIAAVWLIAGGAALLWDRSQRAGAAALAVLYGIFVLFPVPRLLTAPHYLGHHASVYIGVLGSVAEQMILAVAAVVLWMARSGLRSPVAARVVRWAFGLCSINFGLSHLTGVPAAAPMVPHWIPLGGTFWVLFTGVAFVLAGLAIIAGVLDVLASWLLGAMLFLFSVLTLTPGIFATPRNHISWGGDAYNLTAVGAAWIMAAWLAQDRRPHDPSQTLSRAVPVEKRRKTLNPQGKYFFKN